MNRTYLQLVQDFVSEVGVAGGTGPVDIATGKEAKGVNRVIQYIREANDYILTLWPNWDFLWTLEEGTTTAGQVTAGDTLLPFPALKPKHYPTGLGSFQINTGSSWKNLKYVNFKDFWTSMRTGSPKAATARPSFWTHRPNRQIELSHPIGAVFDYRYQYYREPPQLVDDDDVSIIPHGFDRLILVRAEMIYAKRENAPEHMQGAAAEYEDLMVRLESNYLPGFYGGASTDDEDLVVRDV